MISRNDPCYCGSGKKWKKCHYPQKPSNSFEELKSLYLSEYSILLKDDEQIHHIKNACKLSAQLLQTLISETKEGVTTNRLDQLAREFCKDHNATPAALNYGSPPFPGSICTSLNDVICHGIPDDKPLENGDILNIDVACILNNYFGDCSAMACIGDVDEEKQLVVDVAKDSMMKAINILKPGVKIFEIGQVIEDYARSKDCSVVNAFVSHGVGVQFHEEPQVPHHYNQVQTPLAEGMTFTVEPMINAGVREGYIEKENGWIARTNDGKPSAQWEHTVLITKDGHEILTIP